MAWPRVEPACLLPVGINPILSPLMIRNLATGKERIEMARVFQFDVDVVVEQLNRILQMELAAVIYYTHYSFMIYGHARIPITSWLRDNATESFAHALLMLLVPDFGKVARDL